MPLYNVHLLAPVRVKFLDVEAESQIAAIEAAENGANLDKLFRKGKLDHPDCDYIIDHAEWDDSVTGAVVDEQGDNLFKRSVVYELDDHGNFVPAKDKPSKNDMPDHVNVEEINDALRTVQEGIGADIWYDAREHNDATAEQKINDTQIAMQRLVDAAPGMIATANAAQKADAARLKAEAERNHLLNILSTSLRQAREAMPAFERMEFDDGRCGPEWMFIARDAIAGAAQNTDFVDMINHIKTNTEEVVTPEDTHGYFASESSTSDSYGDDLDAGYFKEGEPYFQLQRYDELEKFATDDEAIRQCILDAKSGDPYAIKQLRLAQADGAVRAMQKSMADEDSSSIDMCP